MDPLLALFGEPAPLLFGRSELHVVHGPHERFPSWMREGVLTNLGQLCKQYQGPLEAARGRSSAGPAGLDFVGHGGQVRVAGARPEALLALGLTLYFSELSAVAPASVKFARELEASLEVPSGSAQVGLFVNAPGSGLPMHHDSHDQLFMQLMGKKRFTYVSKRAVSHPTIPFALDSIAHSHFGSVYEAGFPDALALEQGAQTLELAPGSVFFMPAGTLHRTVEQDEICISLTVAVRPPSKLDLILNALEAKLRCHDRFRVPSYGYFQWSNRDAKQDDPELALLLDEAAQALRTLEEESLSTAWLARQHREGVLASHPGRPFVRYLRVPSTRVRILEQGTDKIRYAVRPANSPDEFGLELALAASEIVEHVLSTHRPITVTGMCEVFEQFDEEEVAELLDQLARVSVLRPLPHR